jgi:hypothetical protein
MNTIMVVAGTMPGMWKQIHIPDEVLVICLAGEGHPCAEDCGSPGGWEDLKSLFKKGRKDPEGRKD